MFYDIIIYLILKIAYLNKKKLNNKTIKVSILLGKSEIVNYLH